ncbi:MAG TPA: TerB family tellurite resistance protein [Gemmatimonadales bacterium]|nr:TerB family tellurite resistance protein [Gemmatimonadales bacterium]
MLDAFRAFLSRATGTPSSSPEPRGADPIRLAACALLLELAHADGEFTAAEREHIEGALSRHFGLDEPTTTELIALAERARTEAVDTFQFTRVITENYDLGQKMVLAEVMWGVILADGQLSEHETYLIRKLANLLDLQPGYLAEARRSARSPDRRG